MLGFRRTIIQKIHRGWIEAIAYVSYPPRPITSLQVDHLNLGIHGRQPVIRQCPLRQKCLIRRKIDTPKVFRMTFSYNHLRGTTSRPIRRTVDFVTAAGGQMLQ